MGSFHQKIAGTPGEDLRVRGQVAVQEHGLQHLGGEGHPATSVDSVAVSPKINDPGLI